MSRRKTAKTGDAPDCLLKMKSRDRKKKDSAVIGVGWTNGAGGVSIKLNKGVHLDWRDSEDQIITLWPIDDDEVDEEEYDE